MTTYINYSKHEDKIAVLSIAHPDSKVNTLGENTLRELNDLVDDIQNEKGLAGLIIKSDKKDFVVGADIGDIETLKSAEETRNAAIKMQGILKKIEDLKIPTVAAINGQCLGGGLELTLACDWRVATENAKFGFPEIQLGLIPGAGGTQRTPRIIGIQAALDLILTGKRIIAKKAQKIGLIDATVHEEQLFEIALTYAEKKRKDKYKPKSKGISNDLTKFATENNPIGRKVMERKAREMVEESSKGFYPAPYKALAAVFDGFDRKLEDGLMIEAKLFGELSQTKESHSLIHLFHATTNAKKNDFSESFQAKFDKKPDPSLVGIIGSGFMGAGIATVLADKGITARLSDPNKESTTRALQNAYKYFQKQVSRRKIKSFEAGKKMAKISPGTSTVGFKNADVVIEAVFEDLDLKQKILSNFEDREKQNTVFATNTSAIPIGKIAEKAKFPERVLGMHFFSPVEKMPLLEIVTTEKTAEWATALAIKVGQRMGKQIIVVKDSPGFYTTRALAFFLAEAAILLTEGASIKEVDDALVDFGFPVGPVTLMDEVGIDVGNHVLDTMSSAFSDRVRLPEGLTAILDSGRLGRKNGKGFYEYQNGKKCEPDDDVYKLLPGWKKASINDDEIIDRCALVFINESTRCLEEKVIQTAYDGDVGAVFGLGFPPFWGGPFKYVDHVGAKVITDRLESLAEKHGKRFEPSELLKEYAKDNKRFFPEEN